MSAPAVFLGKLTDLDNNLTDEYFSSIKDFLDDYSDYYFIWVESSDLLHLGEYGVHYGSDGVAKIAKDMLEKGMNKYCSKRNSSPQKSKTLENYIQRTNIDPKKIISLMINETKSQNLMDIGMALTKLRKKGFLLIGLGNITQKDTISVNEPTEPIKEFDSWVRVKLWEFDYYAVRDIETFFPFERGLYQDRKTVYGPFLVVFGSLEGTDVLYDLFSGFEGNNSLRSFYFK